MEWMDWLRLVMAAMFGASVGLLGMALAVAIRRADDATLGMPDLEGLEGDDEKGDRDDRTAA